MSQLTDLSSNKPGLSVRKGCSVNISTRAALKEIAEAVSQEEQRAVLLFVGEGYDLGILGPEISRAFSVPVIACTTAGELAPSGYSEKSLSAVALAGRRLSVRTFCIDRLAEVQSSDLQSVVTEVNLTLADLRTVAPKTRAFGLLLVDGLSLAEENLIAQLSAALGPIPLFGGSAGDGLRFQKTAVWFDGQFRQGVAVLAVFFTDLPFEIFRTQHFAPVEEKKLVITEADSERRIVKEINGYSAAEEYARMLGIDVSRLDSMVFSKYPLLLKIGGEYYVRSIQKMNEDGSLTFFCAIDEGLVLTLSQGLDILENLEKKLADVEAAVPSAKLIIACECILRRLEIQEKGLTDAMGALMRRHNIIGFHTYGEQIHSFHVNQTMVGVALGAGE